MDWNPIEPPKILCVYVCVCVCGGGGGGVGGRATSHCLNCDYHHLHCKTPVVVSVHL